MFLIILYCIILYYIVVDFDRIVYCVLNMYRVYRSMYDDSYLNYILRHELHNIMTDELAH